LQKKFTSESQNRQSKLPPAYDVTFCEGSIGYHQMDIMGEALGIPRQTIVKLGTQEADLSVKEVDEIISSICEVASRFNKITQERLPEQIRSETLQIIQSRIENKLTF